jgi:hypothetical protein
MIQGNDNEKMEPGHCYSNKCLGLITCFFAISILYYFTVHRKASIPLLNKLKKQDFGKIDRDIYAPVCAGDSDSLCLCIEKPRNLERWKLILGHCGGELTARMLAASLDAEKLQTSMDTTFTELFHRPLALRFPDILPELPSTNLRQQIFHHHANRDIKLADSGRCWYIPDLTIFKCLPSLLLIGFQRAATRELYDWIELHPDIVGYGSHFDHAPGQTASVESHYFDSLPESQPFHGLQPIRRKKILTSLEDSWATTYLADSPSFTVENVIHSRMVFEKTPAYADETDVTTIRKLLPSIKLIVSLREPGSRLWSAYWRRCSALGKESCSEEEFVATVLEPAEKCHLSERVILDEASLNRVSAECEALFPSGFELRAVLLGYYELFLRRYENAFSGTDARMLLLFAETFAGAPFSVLEEVEAFVGLTKFNYTKNAHFEPEANVFVISSKSKALHERHVGYVGYENIEPNIRSRISDLYRSSEKRLKSFLRPKQQFFILSKLVPLWFIKS